jgi:hypothetical protein
MEIGASTLLLSASCLPLPARVRSCSDVQRFREPDECEPVAATNEAVAACVNAPMLVICNEILSIRTWHTSSASNGAQDSLFLPPWNCRR